MLKDKEIFNAINLTKHIVYLYDKENVCLAAGETKKDVELPNVKYNHFILGYANFDGVPENSVPVFKRNFDKTIVLPEKKKDTLYVVPRIVAEANLDRDDLVIVHDYLRDEKTGEILGVKSFLKL